HLRYGHNRNTGDAMTPFKPAAALSSGLLVRKGAAAPAGFTGPQPVRPFGHEVRGFDIRDSDKRAPDLAPFGEARHDVASAPPMPPQAPEAKLFEPPKKTVVETISASTGDAAKASAVCAKVSLRLDAERHRKLRLISAH